MLPVLAGIASSDDPAAESAARERDVLSLMATWMTNKEIAARLGISVDTVRQHTRAIYRKLGVGDRRDAVSLATDLAGPDHGAGRVLTDS